MGREAKTMTRIQRVKSVVTGVLMLLSAAVLGILGIDGYSFIALMLSLSFLIYGIRRLVYYFRMGRHMVGGRSLLYIGVITFDLGVFTLSIADDSQVFIVLYLFVVHLVSGGLGVAQGVQAKMTDAPLWKSGMGGGILNLLLALACLAFVWVPDVVVYVYAAGLAYAAVLRIASAFRRTAIIYIP